MTEDGLDRDDGRGGLKNHLTRLDPPVGLEARVRESLSTRGLIHKVGAGEWAPATPPRYAKWMARVGLLAAGLILGLVMRPAVFGGSSSASRSGQYVLLLYGDPPGDTGVVHVSREREYGRWASALKDAKWVGGNELADVVVGLGPTDAADGSDRLAGYFVIEASSRERAAEVARSCPHLKYGGRVVVMSIAS